MINIIKATAADLDRAMSSRIEMLKVVNGLSEDIEFDKEFIDNTREYLCNSNQTTLLAIDYRSDWLCYNLLYQCSTDI
jgi:hypothetical protein